MEVEILVYVLDNTKYVDSVRAVDLDENGTVDIVASTIGPGGDIKWFKMMVVKILPTFNWPQQNAMNQMT